MFSRIYHSVLNINLLKKKKIYLSAQHIVECNVQMNAYIIQLYNVSSCSFQLC